MKLKDVNDIIKHYDPPTAVTAEGVRIGLTSCKTCGACILLDPRSDENYLILHYDWHFAHGDFVEGKLQ